MTTRARLLITAVVAAAFAVAFVLASTGWGDGHGTRPGPHAPAVARKIDKRFCPAAAPARLAAGLRPSDRQFVPLSSTLLGTKASWSDRAGDKRLSVISGGYVDDVTEAYDNLHTTVGARVSGVPATVLTTVFLHTRVWVAFWRLPGIVAPCDVHAVIARGLPRRNFYAVLASVEPARP